MIIYFSYCGSLNKLEDRKEHTKRSQIEWLWINLNSRYSFKGIFFSNIRHLRINRRVWTSFGNISFPYLSKTSLTGTMNQIFQYIIYLPILLLPLNSINRQSNAYHLLQIMIQITTIITSNEISVVQVQKLRVIFTQYFNLRKVALPGTRNIIIWCIFQTSFLNGVHPINFGLSPLSINIKPSNTLLSISEIL